MIKQRCTEVLSRISFMVLVGRREGNILFILKWITSTFVAGNKLDLVQSGLRQVQGSCEERNEQSDCIKY
jgi:hypothetical protein